MRLLLALCLFGLASSSLAQPERVTQIATSGDAAPAEFTVLDDVLYFTANDRSGFGQELWRYDADSDAASRVVRVTSGPSDGVSSLTVYDGRLYFVLSTFNRPSRLMVLDGAAARELVSFERGIGSLTVFDGELYFRGGREGGGFVSQNLYAYSDGRPDAEAVREITPGQGDNLGLTPPVEYDGRLYVSADDDDNGGAEVWSTDGTDFRRETDVNDAGDSNPGSFVVYDGALYFSASRPGPLGFRNELYSLRGDAVTRVTDVNVAPVDPVVYDGALYFNGSDADAGRELWRYDGSTAARVADVRPGEDSSSPLNVSVFDGVLYFQADDGTTGRELWRYTEADGASRVADLASGEDDGVSSSTGARPTVYRGALYFAAAANNAGTRDVWRYDGRAFTASGSERPVGVELALAGPNPAHSRTALRLTVAGPERVRVVVVDALGRRVATLLDATLVGETRIEVDTSRLVPGTYRALATGETVRASQPLTVLR